MSTLTVESSRFGSLELDASQAIQFPAGLIGLGGHAYVLLRTGDDAFRVECWRSFSDYAFAFLTDAAKDAAA